jgi:hypothetical protein
LQDHYPDAYRGDEHGGSNMQDEWGDLDELPVEIATQDPEGNGRRLTIPIDLIYGESVSPFERLANGTISIVVPTVHPQPIMPPDLRRTLCMCGALLRQGPPTFSTAGSLATC